MSVRGGRVALRLSAAVAVALLLLPILPLSPAIAQSASDPWWGPSDRAKPTAGWALRVPVVVENKYDFIQTDPFVTAEIDFSELLVRAGWTNQTVGAQSRVRGFTLDIDSLRVVEYNRGFVSGPLNGADTRPTPHVFYPALFEEAKFREFRADNPAGTLLFQIAGELKPLEKRYFYVYANPLEFVKTPAPVFDALEKSPLDAFMWGTRGNVYLGYEPQQDGQAHVLVVKVTAPGSTRITVSTYDLGRFQPVASTAQLKNPVILQTGAEQVISIPANKAYRIEGDKPFLLWSHGDGEKYEAYGYVPGRSGSFADDVFDVHGTDATQGGLVAMRITKASPGVVNVFCDGFGPSCGGATLTNANPSQIFGIPANQWSVIRGSGKFLISQDPLGAPSADAPEGFIPHQVPAVSGGPSGIDFFSLLNPDAGYYRLCPEADATLRVIDFAGGSLQIYPEGTLPGAPAARLEKRAMCHEVAVQKSLSGNDVFEFYSTNEARNPAPNSPVPFRLFVGAKDRVVDNANNFTRPMIGHYGGLQGTDYYLDAPAGLFGHYNNTRLTIIEEKTKDGVSTVTNRTRSLQRDEYIQLPQSGDGSVLRYHVLATKPFAAASLSAAQYETCPPGAFGCISHKIKYSQYVPARPMLPNTTIGKAEFRGPLVELRSPDTDGRQLFRSTGPGSPLPVRLELLNLGRWLGGEGLTDTVSVSCTTPTGWSIDGCTKEVTLNSGSSERLNVVVTPSADDVNTTRTILVEAKSKAGGVVATFKLIVSVEVRYGVGLWFDVEGGRKTIDPPVGLDPGGTHRYNVILKNTGSTNDAFSLSTEAAREGWTQDLLLDDEPVTVVRLSGGESATLTFRVKAPNLETAPQNIVTLTAQSQSSALAADVVNTATRIRPKVDLELTLDPQTRLAEPNETVKFNLTTRNKGNDVFTVLFRQDSILPKGWNASLGVDEITLNPNPANDPALNYILQVSVTPPPGARAGDLASLKLAAEIDTGGAGGRVAGDEISAVVVVRRVYNLTTPPVFDAEADPGAPLRFVLPVTNRGNGQVTLELLSGAVTPPWPVTLEAEGITLGVNDTADLPLRIDVPAGTPPGAYNLTFTTRLSREALQNLSIPVNVRAISRIEFIGAKEISLTPGRPLDVAYLAKNTGNVEGTFDFSSLVPDGWNATFSPERARLAPGASIPVTLQLNATRDAPDGPDGMSLVATTGSSPPSQTQLTLDVRRPQLSLASVSATGSLVSGELVLVTATIANAGGIQADNVSVALVVDGKVVDKVLLTRIPVGSNALATLSWVATQRGGDVKVVLDPDQEIEMPTRDATSQVVQFGSRLGTPGPGIGLLVLFAVGSSLMRRREDAKTRSSSDDIRTSRPHVVAWMTAKFRKEREER